MDKRLHWIDVLNLQTRWIAQDGMESWFNRLIGRPAIMPECTKESLTELFGYMRRSIAGLHFDEPIDLMWLDTQLKTVTLGLMHFQGAQPGEKSRLPTFRARVKGHRDADLLRVVKDTLLVHFAEYIGEHLDGTSGFEVLRCQGLYKRADRAPLNPEALLAQDIEDKYLQELQPLVDLIGDGGIERCANLFTNPGEVQYCSDVCRFATLQIAKIDQRISVSADKPRRYKMRRKQAE